MDGDAAAKTTILSSVATIELAQDQAQEPLPESRSTQGMRTGLLTTLK